MKENEKPGICLYCHEIVYPKEGYLERDRKNNLWKLIHKECYRHALSSALTQAEKIKKSK